MNHNHSLRLFGKLFLLAGLVVAATLIVTEAAGVDAPAVPISAIERYLARKPYTEGYVSEEAAVPDLIERYLARKPHIEGYVSEDAAVPDLIERYLARKPYIEGYVSEDAAVPDLIERWLGQNP